MITEKEHLEFLDGYLDENKTIKDKIIDLRNNLYDNLPTGEINAFDLIIIIQKHIEKLDELCDTI